MDGNPYLEKATLILQRLEGEVNWYGDTPNMETLARAQVYATLAQAWEARTANLVSCSQKVYLLGSPDLIRERMGQAPLTGVGTPTPKDAS